MAGKKKSKALSGKHKRFADEYLVDCNATRAYLAAGYKSKNADVAAAGAWRLIRSVKVAEYIAKRQNKLSAKAEITQESVIAEYKKLGYSNPRQVAEWGPNGVKLKDSKTLSDDDAACISEVSSKPGEYGPSIKFKLHDKKGALDSIAKHLGMFVEKHEVDIRVSDLAEAMRLARERRKAGK